MKSRCLALAIMTTAGLISAEVPNADRANADYLSPLDFSDKKTNSYRRFLSQKLGLTPFDCGRVVDDASFGPEGIVSVYSRTQNGRRTFYVSSVEATMNIWQRSNSMRDIAQARAVGIRRVDAKIPPAVAEHVREVWLRMLSDQRPLERSRIEFELAEHLRFCIQQPHRSALEAELWLPCLGPNTRALEKISESLWKYCKSAPANRAAIARQIENEATRLLARLK